MILFKKAEAQDLVRGERTQCQACCEPIRLGDKVLYLRLRGDGKIVPFDLRHQYVHIACLNQAIADSDSELWLSVNQPNDEQIIAGLVSILAETK